MGVTGGSTDVSVVVRILDSSDGTPEQGVTSATAGLALWYRREGADLVGLTEDDLAALDDAHADGKMLHIDDGYYRVDIPDAAFAAGVRGVQIGGAATDMVVFGPYIEIDPPVDVTKISGDSTAADNLESACDNYSVTRGLSGTALPAAAADAVGGLPISDAGGLDLDTMNANVSAVLADTGTDGVVLAADAITAAKIADDAIGDEHWNVTAAAANVTQINSVAAAAVRLALSAGQIIPGTVSDAETAPSTTEFAADDITEATADHYNGRLVVWTSGALAGQVTDVTDYELDTGEGLFTVTALTEAPADGDTFVLV